MNLEKSNHADSAFIEFEKFIDDFEIIKQQDISESDTRSKVLDKIFLNVLQWSENDISREGRVDSGYFDYKVSLPGLAFAVEAKRNFKEILLPDRGNTVSLQTLHSQNKDVVEQIRSYLDDLGLSKGIISNGRQFIIGTFINTNGKPWKQNQCLIFRSPEDIKERFYQFFDNISRDSIIENSGFKFEIVIDSVEYQKLIPALQKDKELIKNTLSSTIAPVIEKVFGEIFNDKIEDDADFISQCFVENDEIKKNRDEIDRLFEDRAPNLAHVIPAKNSRSIEGQISREIHETNPSLKELAPKPIIIIGSRGAGKTTFINHFFRNTLPDDIAGNHPSIYTDFRDYYDHNQLLDADKIASDIINKIYDKYPALKLHEITALKRIYYKEIQRNDSSIWSYAKENDPRLYAEKIQSFFEVKLSNNLIHFEHLSHYLIREHRKRVVIIIDNADQFNLTVQEAVFVFAHSLNKTSQCGIIISLREGYYYKWRNSPPFDAYESNVYHISAPKYSDVLQRRIDYTLSHLSLDGTSDGAIGKSMSITIDNQQIVEFLTGLRKSLFDDTNSPLLSFLKNTTFPNIREGLRVFKSFLVSGHTDISEYILRERFNPGHNAKVVPVHEFIKSIGLNNKLYYNHEISILTNLFYPVDGSSDHFIKSRILKFLDARLTDKGASDQFMPANELMNIFLENGFKTSTVTKAIYELLKIGAIETDQIISDTDWKELSVVSTMIALTRKGYYYIKSLIHFFPYIELVLQDTPIYDAKSFSELNAGFPLSDNLGKRKLQERINVAESFVRYLAQEEAKISKEVLSKIGRVINEDFMAQFEKSLVNARETALREKRA